MPTTRPYHSQLAPPRSLDTCSHRTGVHDTVPRRTPFESVMAHAFPQGALIMSHMPETHSVRMTVYIMLEHATWMPSQNVRSHANEPRARLSMQIHAITTVQTRKSPLPHCAPAQRVRRRLSCTQADLDTTVLPSLTAVAMALAPSGPKQLTPGSSEVKAMRP